MSVQHCSNLASANGNTHTETQVIPDSINNFYSGKIAGGAHFSLTNDKEKLRLYRRNQKEIAVGKKGISCVASGTQSSTSENNAQLRPRNTKNKDYQTHHFWYFKEPFPSVFHSHPTFQKNWWATAGRTPIWNHKQTLLWLCNTDSCSLRYLCLSKWKHMRVHTQLIQYSERGI